jgi:cytochrome c biogenesis protein CcmG/thiol:disulfide interchange protein DsbE
VTKSRGPRNKREAPARTGPSGPMIVLGIGALVIAAAALAAVVFTPAASPAASPTASSGGPSSTLPVAASSPAGGAALPAYAAGPDDPAVGRPIPEVDGAGFDGTPVTIKADGKPKLLVFLAHWCPHCQREVPVVQAWIDANGMPAGVELISVATAIDPNRPNYPPETWLARERWQVPVIVDADNRIATLYGLTAFPYWVAVGADGTVAQRLTGELTPDQLDALVTLVSSPS